MYQYLQEELEQLKSKIIRMGSLVETQIGDSFRALFNGDLELSDAVIQKDDEVDKFEVRIDKHCQRIFALTQPVAYDLRLIMASLMINTDLERMGDLAVSVSVKTKYLQDYVDLLHEMKIDELAGKVHAIIRMSIDCFVNGDSDLAKEIIRVDNEIDRLESEIFNMLTDRMKEDNEMIVPCSHILTLTRNIERLADHAANIAEDVIFLIDAKIMKHAKDSSNDSHKGESHS
jgi:phosphate transport system protein